MRSLDCTCYEYQKNDMKIDTNCLPSERGASSEPSES